MDKENVKHLSQSIWDEMMEMEPLADFVFYEESDADVLPQQPTNPLDSDSLTS